MWLLFAAAAAAAAPGVRVHGACAPPLDVTELERLTTPLHADIYLFDEALTRSEAWAGARLRVGEPHALNKDRVTLFVGCATPPLVVGLAFGHFTPGMDCGVARLEATLASVDALEPADARSVKLERLVATLSEWQAAEHCSTGSVQLRAGVFWALASVLAFFTRRACALCWSAAPAPRAPH